MQVTPDELFVRRIVSGGQTGVDQAALQMALDMGLNHGGWCPRGRRCEDGTIPPRFRLTESHSAQYGVRTEQNVMDSDATLILRRGPLRGGTALTHRMTVKWDRPCYQVDLDQVGGDRAIEALATRRWLGRQRVQILNVAGPRQSTAPGIYDQSYSFLVSVFRPTL